MMLPFAICKTFRLRVLDFLALLLKITVILICSLSFLRADAFGEDIELAKEGSYPNQFLLGLSANTPIDKSSEIFERGHASVQLEYSVFLQDQWMLGFGGGYQNLKIKESGKSLAIARVYQRSRKLYRIFHPAYYAVGFELSYLYPSKSQDLIPEISDDFSVEFGTGIVNSILFRFGTTSLFAINANLWRGTGSRKFQAVELGLVFGTSI